MKDIEQNQDGTYFALPYNQNGVFMLRTFGVEPRTYAEIQDNELNINELLGLDFDTRSKPIDDFPDPLITCTFINDNHLFVNFFSNYAKIVHKEGVVPQRQSLDEVTRMSNSMDNEKSTFPTHYHFIWDIKNRKVLTNKQAIKRSLE